LRLGQRQFVAPRERAIAIGVRAALPGQARYIIVNRQTVGVEFVRRLNAWVLRVLAIERLTWLRRGDFAAVVVALGLPGIDEGVGLRAAAVVAEKEERQCGCHCC